MRIEDTFRMLTGYEPYDYQKRAWERIWGIMEEGGVVALEVPTAGGKTEAATIPFFHQFLSDEWLVSRLIYVLPTRSLVRKQAERLKRYMRKVLDKLGRGGLEESIVRIERGMEPTFLFLGSVIVSTWDVFLYGLAAHRTIGTRFTFPAGAIAGALVVFDEVQMYQDSEMYMPQLMSLVIGRLKEAKVPVVVMTATMPSDLKKTLNISEVPMVGVRSSDISRPMRGDVEVSFLERDLVDEEALREIVLRVSSRNGKTLIIRNTVKKAVDTYRKLSKYFGEEEIVLLHSKFTAEDRENLEDRLDSDEVKVIVATQVVEAGLDMPSVLEVVTDLAPLDALVQRIGRCARRPGERGRATILLPDFDQKIAEEYMNRIMSEELDDAEYVSFRTSASGLNVPHVEVIAEKKRYIIIDINAYRRLETRGVLKKRRRRKSPNKEKQEEEILVLPFSSVPYDPLIMLRTLRSVAGPGSLEEKEEFRHYMNDVHALRRALDYVYRLHYKHKIVSRHFYEAYLYFRQLRLFSAPPEVVLRSRPRLYSVLMITEEKLENGKEINLDPKKMIRVDYSWLLKKSDVLDVKYIVRSEYDKENRRYRYKVEELVGERPRPRPYLVHPISPSKYDKKLGLLPEGDD